MKTNKTRSSIRLADWLVFAGTLLLALLILRLAPAEQTLGQGIRAVYVHVALTWVGMTSLAVAGVIGAVTLFTANLSAQAWSQRIGWVGLGFFAAGLLLSILAARVNWGAPFWQEPRMAAALNLLAFGLITQVAGGWLPWPRLRGGLHLALALFMVWVMRVTPLVLHPRNPISSSSSRGIQVTFAGMLRLFAIAAT